MSRIGDIGARACAALIARSALVLLTAASAAGQTASSTPAAAADQVERVSWRGEIATASRLEVSNPFGDLRLRYGGADRTVEVTVVLQQVDPSGGRLELEVDETADPATVRVVRAEDAGSPAAYPGANRSRADVVVLVPAGLAVHARTDRGLAESSGLESEVELETVSGSIRVRSTSGSVRAHSDRGEISATLLSGFTKAPQSLTTVTGSIEVWVGDPSNLSVILATSGRLISDFSMQVEHFDLEEPDKVATVTVGDGGNPLEIRSLRGDVSLRRLMNPDRHVVSPVENEAPR